MPNYTAEMAIARAGTPTRFRALKAQWIAIRILAGYLWLRLWRPVLGPSLYNARLVARHRRNSKRLVDAILELKGLFIKVGQLISILTNFLPPEFRAELEQLQDAVPPRPLDEVVARIHKEFGKSPEELFASFDPIPMASASLAQVHEARLHDGRRVAVKVQHADIETIAKLDLEILGNILGLVQLVVRIRGLDSYHADISQMIREELDFRQEARHIGTIASHFAGSREVHFPTVVAELSSERVLTTEFVVGTKVTDFEELERLGVSRPALAQRILTAYCQMVFVDGVFHADPHPGNILVHPDGSITFVDFGAVGRLASNIRLGIRKLWEGIIRRDAATITAGLREMGLIARDPTDNENDAGERAIAYFQRRFLEQMTLESFSLKNIQVDVKTKLEAMADLKKLDVSFRQLSNAFQVPKEWVIFERASILLLGLCTQIDPDMNPIRTVGPYLQEFVIGKDADWKGQITSAIREMAMSAIAIPEKTNRLLERANRGDMQLQIRGLRESALLLYAAAQQLVFVFFAIATGALGYVLSARGQRGLAIAAWVVTGLSLIAVAAAIVGARGLRKGLRKTRADRP